eukprot:Rmarinus@m.21010
MKADETSCSIRVVARFRPLSDREEKDVDPDALRLDYTQNSVSVKAPYTNEQFTFDRVFSPDTSQETLYTDAARPPVEDVLQGYNGTIFAYGQTGSGKTFSMFGPPPKKSSEDDKYAMMGIVPRAAQHVFEFISEQPCDTEYMIRCSYVEIYNETIRDLLDAKKVNLKIRESPTSGVYIAGVTEEYVGEAADIMDIISIGDSIRAVAATNMNLRSSRSHTLFCVTIEQREADGSSKVGRLNLVDLAGSEKVGRTGAEGQTLKEAQNINRSLSALGNCIAALVSSDPKRKHVPFRDSKLTRILQDSLGGNTKTTLLVACSPHHSNVEETVSTLKFAQRAKAIKNQVRVNAQMSPGDLERLVETLQQELRALKQYAAELEKENEALSAGRAPRSSVDGSGASGNVKSSVLDMPDPAEHAELKLAYEKLKATSKIQAEELQEEVAALRAREEEQRCDILRLEGELKEASHDLEYALATQHKKSAFEASQESLQVNSLEEEKKRLMTELSDLRHSLTTTKAGMHSVESANEQLSADLGSSRAEVERLRAALSRAEAIIEKMEAGSNGDDSPLEGSIDGSAADALGDSGSSTGGAEMKRRSSGNMIERMVGVVRRRAVSSASVSDRSQLATVLKEQLSEVETERDSARAEVAEVQKKLVSMRQEMLRKEEEAREASFAAEVSNTKESTYLQRIEQQQHRIEELSGTLNALKSSNDDLLANLDAVRQSYEAKIRDLLQEQEAMQRETRARVVRPVHAAPSVLERYRRNSSEQMSTPQRHSQPPHSSSSPAASVSPAGEAWNSFMRILSPDAASPLSVSERLNPAVEIEPGFKEQSAAVIGKLETAVEALTSYYKRAVAAGRKDAVQNGCVAGGDVDVLVRRDLCTALASVLLVGFKSYRLFGQYHIWDFISGLRVNFDCVEVRKLSLHKAICHINRLPILNSDAIPEGNAQSMKFRAWVCLAVNEQWLHEWFEILCQESSLVSRFYERLSLVRVLQFREQISDVLLELAACNFSLPLESEAESLLQRLAADHRT